MGLLLKKLGLAPEKLGFAPEKLGCAMEKLGFAPEKLGFTQKSSGSDFGTFRSTFWAGTVNLGVPKNIRVRGNYFLVRIHGNPPHPDELYAP